MHFEKSFSIKLGIYDGPTFENVNFEINMNKKKESFMLKRIMKTALAASLVLGMSYTAMADVSVGGSFKEYFGQYNSGADDYTAHFDNAGEANLKLKGSSGKVSVYYEIESRTQLGKPATAGNTPSIVNATQRKVSYLSDFGLISIGTITNIGSIPLASSGWKTSNFPGATRKGLFAGYTEADGIDLVLPLGDMGFVEVSIIPEPAVLWGDIIRGKTAAGYVAATGLATAGDAFLVNQGQTISLGANLNLGGPMVRLGFATETVDNPSSSADTAQSSTYLLASVKMPMGNMAIAAAFSTATVNLTSALKTEITNTSVTLEMADLGPGKLIAAVDMTTIKDTSAFMNMSFNYDVSLADGAGLQVGYIADTNTPDGGTAVTESFMGAGFYIAF